MADLALLLDVDHDELEARLRVTPSAEATIADREGLREALRENRVQAGLIEEAIEEAFTHIIEAEEPGRVFVIAKGKCPEHGKDGNIEFKVDVSGQAVYTGSAGADGTVDFREATTVISVSPGEIIAELIPPTDGKPGMNLAGKPIAARKGKAYGLRLGEGAELAADGRFVHATQQGRPLFTSGILLVSPIYEIGGDVDYNTGNVKFDGHVIVHGNVQDDFRVEAKSIEVFGVIGAAVIECQGDLHARGGVNGRDKAEVRVQGDAICKYVNQGHLTVLGNVTVNREIVNSTIWSRGKVAAEKIIGGECLALQGVEAGYLGSEMGVSTVISPGVNFEVRKIDKVIEGIGDRIDNLLRPIEAFFEDRSRYKALPEEKKQGFRAAYETFKTLRENYLLLIAKRNELIESSEFQPIKQVVVHRLLNTDVFVRTDLCMRQFKEPIKGPISLVEDIDASTIRIERYTGRSEHGDSGGES